MRTVSFYRGLSLAAAVCGVMAWAPAAFARELALPARAASAQTGSQFKNRISSMALADRETAIFQEVMAGNVPDFLRPLVPVNLTAKISGISHSATIYVTADYLAVGSNSDYFRIPMTPLLAQRIADATSMSMPTRCMVNAIWTAAPQKLNPQPIAPSPQMVTVPVFWDHQQMVEAQMNSTSATRGVLTAGQKKDVVITPLLYDPATPKRVAIYGWHYTTGVPIQGLYLGHQETYADYSHGTRLVDRRVVVDGHDENIADVLMNPALAPLLNDESTAFSASAPPRYAVSQSDVAAYSLY